MEQATYIGSDPKLQDKTALIRVDPDDSESVLAQFDDVTIDSHKTSIEDCLAHGWTRFNRLSFETYEGT